MFETSVIRTQAVAARRRFSLASVLIAHSLAIVGAVAVSVATVDFPKDAPNQFELLRPVASLVVPPPLGTPEGNNKPETPKPKPISTPPAPAQQASQQTAPSVVPSETPQVPVAGPASEGPSDPNAQAGTGPRGVAWGDPNSVATDLDLPPVTAQQPVEDKIYAVSGDVKAPRVLTRVDPRYPEVMLRAKKGATVRARCTVDKTGAVRDIQVVFSTFPAFNDAVEEAMQKWRFTPGSLNGRAVDTVFELTVNFSAR